MSTIIDMPGVVTPAKRALGVLLAELRQRAGLYATDIAQTLGYTPTTISRYETGRAVPSPEDLETLLDLYGADQDVRTKVEEAAAKARGATKRIRHDGVSPDFRSFLRAEADAASVTTLAPLAVPGLLQTASYAATVQRTGRALADSAIPSDRVVAAKMGRQCRLRAIVDPLHLHAVLGEEAIVRCTALGSTGQEQLDHLADIGTLPNVVLQVVPLSIGVYGTMSGPTTLFQYSDDPVAVYLEYAGGGAWVRGKDVERYERLLADVRLVALDPDSTMSLINRARRS